MEAVVQRRYGSPDLLELDEVDVPAVADDEVLLRVRAASVHPDVWHVVRGLPYVLRFMGAGLRRPKNPVPGTDAAGRVEAVGEDVTRFAPGDEVFGETIGGHQWSNGGAYAEYVAAPADALAAKPSSVTFEEAAAVPTSGLIALQGVRYQGDVQRGQRVLVNGAGGGVGTVAVQLAKSYGAAVTGVDHTEKLDVMRAIGADHVIDYTSEEFTRGSERYDLVLDVPGNHSFSRIRRVLAPGGQYVLVGHDHYGAVGRRYLGSLPRFARLMALSAFVDELSGMGFSSPSRSDAMAELARLLESGELTPVVARTYPLREVIDAVRDLESDEVCGKIVIDVTG